jgi:hypothetical protein
VRDLAHMGVSHAQCIPNPTNKPLHLAPPASHHPKVVWGTVITYALTQTPKPTTPKNPP